MSRVYILIIHTLAQIREIIFHHISSFLHIVTHDNSFGVYKNGVTLRGKTEYKWPGCCLTKNKCFIIHRVLLIIKERTMKESSISTYHWMAKCGEGPLNGHALKFTWAIMSKKMHFAIKLWIIYLSMPR